MKRRENIDLTVVVTAHDEGIIAHKTMLSVFEALKRVEDAGYTYEVIVHIDNGDERTVGYFERYRGMHGVRVFENKFGDLGLSRNYAIMKARGEIVAFLDGDDLISDNWYVEAVTKIRNADNEVVVHPEVVLTFGVDQPNIITIQKSSRGLGQDLIVLLGENCWCSVVAAKKSIFEKYPYRKMGNGYSFEDYAFNLDVMNGGVAHVIAEKTVLFYRKSGFSMLAQKNTEHAVLPYNEIFDFDVIRDIKIGDGAQIVGSKIKEKSYRLYKRIRGNDFLNFFITPFAKLTLRILKKNRTVQRGIPKYVIDEWGKINHIETQLYPYRDLIKGVQLYDPMNYVDVGRKYMELTRHVTKLPDYVFVVPWLVRGGADKVLLNYIRAMKEINPEWHFAVISTLPAKNIWKDKLPEYVDFIDFGNIADGLVPAAQELLFSRIIVQLKCWNLHIINSEYGYAWARNHRLLLGAEYNLYTSLFCAEFIPGSDLKGIYSYDNPGLFEIIDVVKRCFTDNLTIINKTVERNAFDPDKFRVHYQPMNLSDIKKPKRGLVEPGKLHILWASRVTPTKLPDLVDRIGRGLNPDNFVIDIYGERSDNVDENIFSGVKAIRYHGAFDGFESLPTDEADVLLYTALDDGVPNIILEATLAGLPVIASDDGGVGEFIKDKETGILIKDYLNPEAYINVIKDVLRDPDPLSGYVSNAQKLLLERHSWGKFKKVVERDML